jgi:hypothetical protein
MGLANPTRHAFENNRKALTRTINGATSIEDISFLRRDLNSGGGVLEKRLANTVDPEEKAEIRKHIAWLKTEYRDLLNKKAKELKDN